MIAEIIKPKAKVVVPQKNVTEAEPKQNLVQESKPMNAVSTKAQDIQSIAEAKAEEQAKKLLESDPEAAKDVQSLAEGKISHEDKVAEAEREAAAEAEKIYNQQQKEGSPAPESEAGIAGVEESAAQQPALSPEEEKKQLKAELAKASRENEAQQKANFES